MEQPTDRAGRQDDYPMDIAYTANYYSFLAPRWLRYIALLNAQSPSTSESFDYVELGCGKGLSLIIHAAAHPDASFVGLDLNPEHVDFAAALAARCGLSNVSFRQADLRVPSLADELPNFDFIAMHGLYSWVGPDVRSAIHALVDRKLNPGGIVCVSYNAMPGWGGVAPLREIMRSYTAHLAGNSLERARQGLRYLRWLCDQGSDYFKSNPMAKRRLERLESSDLRYIAHEYFPDQWFAFYFHEVEREFAAQGLRFAGPALAVENYRDLTLSKGALEALGKVKNRRVFESHCDFMLNSSFRRDIFVKPGIETPASTLLDATKFCAVVPPDQFKYDLKVPAGTVHLDGDILKGLVSLLQEPHSAADLADSGRMPGHSNKAIRAAIARLVITGQVVPAGSGQAPPPAANRRLCEHQVRAGSSVSLASSITGAGLKINPIDAVLLLGISNHGEAGAVAGALEWMDNAGVKVRTAEAEVPADAVRAQLEKGLEAAIRLRDERLVPLGIWPAANDGI